MEYSQYSWKDILFVFGRLDASGWVEALYTCKKVVF